MSVKPPIPFVPLIEAQLVHRVGLTKIGHYRKTALTPESAL